MAGNTVNVRVRIVGIKPDYLRRPSVITQTLETVGIPRDVSLDLIQAIRQREKYTLEFDSLEPELSVRSHLQLVGFIISK